MGQINEQLRYGNGRRIRNYERDKETREIMFILSWFQASPAVSMRSALFWDFTQRKIVVSYWRFGMTCSPIFKGQVVQEECREHLGTPFPTSTAYLNITGIFLGHFDPFFTFMVPCIFNVFRYNQQDAKLHNDIYYYKCSTCFRRFLRPSSGAQNYTLHRVFVKLLMLPTACVSKLGLICMFQAIPPPIIRSSKLYTQHRVFVELLVLPTACVSKLGLVCAWKSVPTYSCKR